MVLDWGKERWASLAGPTPGLQPGSRDDHEVVTHPHTLDATRNMRPDTHTPTHARAGVPARGEGGLGVRFEVQTKQKTSKRGAGAVIIDRGQHC